MRELWHQIITNGHVYGGHKMNRVLGTDTSHWSGTINFNTMYNAGARFWYTKATDANKYSGEQYEDSKLLEYSEAVFRQAKLLTGCYHWLQASVDPKTAAKFYLERYKRFPYHFPPMMDFEEREVFTTNFKQVAAGFHTLYALEGNYHDSDMTYTWCQIGAKIMG